MALALWLRILHFLGILLWMGGMVGMATTLQLGHRSKVAGILSDIGILFAMATGITMAIRNHYFAQPWLHIKLTLVVLMLGVHGVLRKKTRTGENGGATGLLSAGIILVTCIIYVIVMKPFMR